jgi:hypothetical protein
MEYDYIDFILYENRINLHGLNINKFDLYKANKEIFDILLYVPNSIINITLENHSYHEEYDMIYISCNHEIVWECFNRYNKDKSVQSVISDLLIQLNKVLLYAKKDKKN